jgi:iron complex outermembrane receptor protein
VKNYTAVDARLAWKSKSGLELALVGQNLLDSHHQEFGGNPVAVEIRRSVFGQVTYRW